VFLGLPNVNPQMAVTPLSLSDTLLVAEMSTHNVTVSNVQPSPSSLNYTVTESPSVGWLSVSPTAGIITSGQSDVLDVT
ncbi:MAG: hypothetical protein GWN00_26590, partial [Aliifodinibius sp.]|nr:hypothetical protein [Fodinibius sp.]NIY28241.1 hypothetical protein [Fodinibius sp.]